MKSANRIEMKLMSDIKRIVKQINGAFDVLKAKLKIVDLSLEVVGKMVRIDMNGKKMY